MMVLNCKTIIQQLNNSSSVAILDSEPEVLVRICHFFMLDLEDGGSLANLRQNSHMHCVYSYMVGYMMYLLVSHT